MGGNGGLRCSIGDVVSFDLDLDGEKLFSFCWREATTEKEEEEAAHSSLSIDENSLKSRLLALSKSCCFFI